VSVSAVILAAGKGSRFTAGKKLAAEINGIPILRRVAIALAQSTVNDVIVVVRPNDTDTLRALGSGRWRAIENADADRGLSSSLRAGIEAVDDTSSGVLVALGDMPMIETATVNALAAEFKSSRCSAIVFPQNASGWQGHPVIWPRDLFAALCSLSGDAGAKTLFETHRARCRPILVDGTSAFADVDTVDELTALTRND
jgi:molybdenum cofactor cytidylyltransferase